jgi:hypothetical protein
MSHVRIFDTTLRDGEQSPGFSMNTEEKIRMARQLAALGVDVVKPVFRSPRRGDLEAVQAVAKEVRDVPIAALARARKDDILAAVEALKPAKSPRMHVFLATSDLHLQAKLHLTREQALEAIGSMIKLARNYVEEIEFSAEDAGRTEIEYLCKACQIAVDRRYSFGLRTVGCRESYGRCFAVREYTGDPEHYVERAFMTTLACCCPRWPRFTPAFARSNAVNGSAKRRNAALEVLLLAVRKDSFGVAANNLKDFTVEPPAGEITGAVIARIKPLSA